MVAVRDWVRPARVVGRRGRWIDSRVSVLAWAKLLLAGPTFVGETWWVHASRDSCGFTISSATYPQSPPQPPPTCGEPRRVHTTSASVERSMLNGIYAGSQYQVRIQWDNGGKGLKTQKCCGRHKSSAYNQHANSRGELHVPVRVRGLLCVFRRAKFPADLGRRKDRPRARADERTARAPSVLRPPPAI